MQFSFVYPMTCNVSRVPTNARQASAQIQSCIRTALAAGKRRVSVDVLIASVDARARTFDDSAGSTIFTSLVESVKPFLPVVQVVVPGSTTALRIRRWIGASELKEVSVCVLGIEDEGHRPDALLVVDPPGSGNGILDLRRVLQAAHKKNLPVIVHNQPRQDALYKLLGFGGGVPYELARYENAFVLAPFSLQGQDEGPAPRFVLLREFPRKWELWRYHDSTQDPHPKFLENKGTYSLVQDYDSRPSDNELMTAVSKSLKTS